MTDYKTPKVYVEEISTLPSSIVGVSTGIPAFIGYTEKAENDSGEDLTNIPTRITSIIEYESFFGKAQPTFIEVFCSGTPPDEQIESIKINKPRFFTYYALQMFFSNGGGPCYIVSIGSYIDDNEGNKKFHNITEYGLENEFTSGLKALEGEDEPSLIVMNDLIPPTSDGSSFTVDSAYKVYNIALTHCSELKNRFVIFDVLEAPDAEEPDPSIKAFRNDVSGDLNYSAAYYPYLQTSLSYYYLDNSVFVTVIDPGLDPSSQSQGDDEALLAKFLAFEENPDTAPVGTLESYKTQPLYSKIVKEISKQQIILPPSSSVAGVYARVDKERGVWKAPANVSLSAVKFPVTKITDLEQETLNVDTEGKSINAIRFFTGKGVLVWGARTLEGNSNEWRYISVRRFFIYVEESVKKATAFAVFEPNSATTWLKVKSMIENFLEGLWRQGALMGSSTKDAFFVHVGIGITMTQQDILEGRMIVEIGLAVVRPAEFVILRFSHKLEQ
jgi:phage tail sheath protein FI